MNIIIKIFRKILDRIMLCSLAGMAFFILIITLKSLKLSTGSYINWVENDFIVFILLVCFGAFLIYTLRLLNVYSDYKHIKKRIKRLKNLSSKERKKENCKMQNEIIKYINGKYGNDHNLELVDIVNKEDEYNMIYKKPKNPQKIKVSFDKKSKTIEENLY